ncbi:di-sulfide bridge nucleocytoplasmic transport protein [Hamiltosporidium tvaerminnensis]|uniref:Di-sulfide bridge nucleocytoplasmic transport protein n=1 Tax=Hamiltosporidium tvaerminnensis TaxID=1176355 RepID=A0A4Q9L574_9MICR|nr:di-sulfide bridge nucleocytoplasmic transport protein [Hamiltosporidium tvaerminnensis]
MKEVPLNVEMELKWKNMKQKEIILEKCKYLSPIKKRKIENTFPLYLPDYKIQENERNIEKKVESEQKDRQKWKFSDIKPYILNAPFVIISYLHLFFNILIITILSYTLVAIAFGIQKDVRNRIFQRKIQISKIIEESKKNYFENKCHPSTRVPALNKLCMEWECNMQRGIDSAEFTRIFVEVLGDVCDAFVRKFSFKTTSIFAGFFVLFLIFRNKNSKK